MYHLISELSRLHPAFVQLDYLFLEITPRWAKSHESTDQQNLCALWLRHFYSPDALPVTQPLSLSPF